MAYDLEEQEQLASLKAWWNQYGNLTTWVLIAGLAAYSGWTGWNVYQGKQAAQASALFDKVQEAAAAKDNAKVQRAASDMESMYGSTAYGPMAALAAAKSAFEANDNKTAKAQLQWVVEHGVEEYKSVARLRLAGVLLDEKAYDEALKVLADEKSAQFAGAKADRTGDILVAQNKLKEARAAYKEALDASDKKNPGRRLIELKYEAIGGSVPSEVAAGAPAGAA